jgi:hypothetical protein
MKKKTTTNQTTDNNYKSETCYIQIHPKLYHHMFSREDMQVYMELIIQSLHQSIDNEEYEKSIIYKRIFDWNNKRLEGSLSISGWNQEDTELASRWVNDESGCYFV